jgi:RNA polymerase sigma-70 factor, ECF subfamily
MHERADRLAGSFVGVDRQLEQEFEARLVESSTLAFRVAYGVLRHRQDAEDVAQEAFVKAYRSFRELRDRARFRAWLVRMTWRLAIDRQRADRRREAREHNRGGLRHMSPAAEESPVAQAFRPQAVEEMMSRERTELLWHAIDALPEKLRVVVVLANIEGHDVREVAALLGLPDGTVKSRLFLARQRLKEKLQWVLSDTAAR